MKKKKYVEKYQNSQLRFRGKYNFHPDEYREYSGAEGRYDGSSRIYHEEFKRRARVIATTYHPAWFRSNWIPISRDGAPWMSNDIRRIRLVCDTASMASEIVLDWAKRSRSVTYRFARKSYTIELSAIQRNIFYSWMPYYSIILQRKCYKYNNL